MPDTKVRALLPARRPDRLRALGREHGHEVRIFCAHDPVELTGARAGA